MSKRPLVFLLSALILLFCITGCRSCKSKKKRLTQNNTLYTSQQCSDCLIDSSFIAAELVRDSSLRPYAEEILDFYQRRNYDAAWFDGDTLTISAYDLLNTLHSYEKDFGDHSLLSGQDLGAVLISGSHDAKAQMDLRLTAAFFRYADRAYGGTSEDLRDLEWYIPRRKKDYQRLIDTLVASPSSYSIYEPVNAYYKTLKQALIDYRDIEKHGGLPQIHVASLPLRTRDSSDAVAQLKRSLSMTGDYDGYELGELYNDRLTAAVLRYQERMGLPMSGIVDSFTLIEINTPIEARIRQIMLNMERLRWMPDELPERYILVNIPEYRLHVFDHGGDSLSMDIVVGRAASATSIFAGRLSVVDFGPYWNVPVSIIRHELLPKLKQDPGYLAKNNMEAVIRDSVINTEDIDWHRYKETVPFDIRQRPGPDNSLGLVAFFFPNSFDIYLHDTPAKSLFNESTRAFSHGCIRLSQAEKLADYIFRDDRDMPPDRIRALMDEHGDKKFPVNPSIPVYIVYFTAWVDHAGRVNFRHDIYGHDARLAHQIFGR